MYANSKLKHTKNFGIEQSTENTNQSKMTTQLISKEEVIQGIGLKKYGLAWTADFIMQALGLHQINQFYAALPSQTDGLSFLATAMKNLNVNFPVPEDDWANIPREGAFISVSNHPFGMLDGILLIMILGKVRPDAKVMANFLLQRIEPIKHFFISVDPFETANQTSRSLAGTKLTLQHLKDGHPVGIFPAGEVSSVQKRKDLLEHIPFKIQDRTWQIPVMKIIRKAQVPVLPIYFHGQNSPLFHFLGRIHPLLRTTRLINEFLNKRNKTIPIRIGSPISVAKQNEFEKLEDLATFLKKETYSLSKTLDSIVT